jgi:hypothetical protein
MLIVILITMGIQSFLFGQNSKKAKKAQDELNRKRLAELNNQLNELYHKSTIEQDEFELKRVEHDKSVGELNSKRVEVENRINYLEGLRAKFGDKMKNNAVSLLEFKELCKNYVDAFNDNEVAQNDMHSIEVETEASFEIWDEISKDYQKNIDVVRKQIEDILSEIRAITTVS